MLNADHKSSKYLNRILYCTVCMNILGPIYCSCLHEHSQSCLAGLSMVGLYLMLASIRMHYTDVLRILPKFSKIYLGYGSLIPVS